MDQQLLANEMDIVMLDKQQKMAVVINVAIPAHSNNRGVEGLKELLGQT